jgi:UDP:flavonoid glycosyltransferase YjiC (YdhE family)
MPKQTWQKHRAMLETTPSLLLVSPHVLPHPTDWQPHHQITGYIFDNDNNWQAPQDLLDFLTSGEKPVYIGFGSMREANPEKTTQLFLDALEQTGKRGILLSGWAGFGASNLPKNVFLLKYAPQNWLFPRMAAVVHHGGAGTTAAGLYAGVPSVVIPILSDQPFWGERVHQLGVGTKPIPRAKLTATNLAAAITEATTNQAIQEKAAVLGTKIRAENGVSSALNAIKQFLVSITT